jgi:hypothetical protein
VISRLDRVVVGDAGGGTGSPVDAGSSWLRTVLAGGSLTPVGTRVVFHLISKRPS